MEVMQDNVIAYFTIQYPPLTLRVHWCKYTFFFESKNFFIKKINICTHATFLHFRRYLTKYETISRPTATCAGPRHRTPRPHGYGDCRRFRLPDALRPRQGFPPADDEEAAPALDYLRAAVVPARRDEYTVPAPSGPTRTATWVRCTAASGARGPTARAAA